MIVTPLLAFLLLAPPEAHAGCDPSELDGALRAAEEAFVTGASDSMDDALSDVKKALSCTRDPVPPTLCARIHRARALGAWLVTDADEAFGSLRAMVHADPRFDLPSSLPVQHPLRRLLIDAEESEMAWAPAPSPGWVLVDGLRTGSVPIGQPYVAQRLKDDGQAQKARIVDQRATEGPAPRNRAPARRALRWTGFGLGVISAGMYGAAWSANGAYQSAVLDGDNARIDQYHSATNRFAVGSVATVGLGVGALVSAELVRH